MTPFPSHFKLFIEQISDATQAISTISPSDIIFRVGSVARTLTVYQLSAFDVVMNYTIQPTDPSGGVGLVITLHDAAFSNVTCHSGESCFSGQVNVDTSPPVPELVKVEQYVAASYPDLSPPPSSAVMSLVFTVNLDASLLTITNQTAIVLECQGIDASLASDGLSVSFDTHLTYLQIRVDVVTYAKGSISLMFPHAYAIDSASNESPATTVSESISAPGAVNRSLFYALVVIAIVIAALALICAIVFLFKFPPGASTS